MQRYDFFLIGRLIDWKIGDIKAARGARWAPLVGLKVENN